MRRKITDYRLDCRRSVRRGVMGGAQRIFCGDCSDYLFWNYSEEDKIVCRRSGALCYGASGVSYADRRQCFTQHVGTRMVIYKEGRHGDPVIFIKKAGTVILLSTVFIWFTSSFGIADGQIVMVEDLSDGFLAGIGRMFAWLFIPLGWGDWQAAVAAITGLVAKENVVGTFGVLYGFAEVAEDGAEIWGTLAASMTGLAAYSFLVFNLLCAPCFAAIGAIKREMNNGKWTLFAIGYQCAFAYAVSMCIYQFGVFFADGSFGVGTIAAILMLVVFLYLLFRPHRETTALRVKLSSVAVKGAKA